MRTGQDHLKYKHTRFECEEYVRSVKGHTHTCDSGQGKNLGVDRVLASVHCGL